MPASLLLHFVIKLLSKIRVPRTQAVGYRNSQSDNQDIYEVTSEMIPVGGGADRDGARSITS